MNRLKTNRILVPFDFSKTAGNAIKYAAFTAKLLKAELVLLNVQRKTELLDIIMPAVKLKDVSVITDYVEEKLEKVAESLSKNFGIKVSSLTSMGHIPTEIANIADEMKCDLIVMGTRGKESKNDFFMGSNAYHTITKSVYPVMTVQKASAKLGFSRIILPMDSSAHTRQKVHSAIYLAEKFGASIHMVGLLHKNEMQDKFKMETIFNQIKQLADKKKIKCSGTIVQSDNHAAKTLSFTKQAKGSLIVSMTDQSTEFRRGIISTYINQLVNESKIPVLCIPPEIHPENIKTSLGGLW